MFELFLEQYGMELLYTIIIALFGYFGLQAKALYERYVNTKEKQAVAKTVCEAIEQIYKDLGGEEKKQLALENISAMLAEKGITITELEMEMLIESAVYGFNSGLTKETEAIETNNQYVEEVAAVLKEVNK